MTTTSMAATKAWQTRNANQLQAKLSNAGKKAWETRRKNTAKGLVNTGLKTVKSRRELHVLINKLTHKEALKILHTLISPKK